MTLKDSQEKPEIQLDFADAKPVAKMTYSAPGTDFMDELDTISKMEADACGSPPSEKAENNPLE